MTAGDKIRFLRSVPSGFEGTPPLAELNEVGVIKEIDEKRRAWVETERGAFFCAEDWDFEVLALG